MVNLELVVKLAGIFTGLGAIAAFIYTAKSFYVSKRYFHNDIELRTKQNTIEHYNKLSERYTIPLREKIAAALGESLTDYSYTPIDKIPLTPDLCKKLVTYCRAMNRFASGISNRVFDIETFFLVSGPPTIALYNQISPVISKMKVDNELGFHNELIKLVQKLEEIQKNLPVN